MYQTLNQDKVKSLRLANTSDATRTNNVFYPCFVRCVLSQTSQATLFNTVLLPTQLDKQYHSTQCVQYVQQ